RTSSSTRLACQCSVRLRSPSAFWRKPCWRSRSSRLSNPQSRWLGHRDWVLLAHDLRANVSRLSQGKTAHFSGSRALALDEMQHLCRCFVKAPDFADVGRERLPRTGGGIGGLEPFWRGIVVVAAEAVAAVITLADLEARVKHAIQLQRAPDAPENVGQVVT